MKCFWGGERGGCVVMGDMNAKVGCYEIGKIVGGWGVPGVNKKVIEWMSVLRRVYFLQRLFFSSK